MKFHPRCLKPVALFTGVLALASHSPVMAADIYWNNTGTGSWTTGTDWIGDAAPGAGDVAFLTNSGTITLSSGDDASVNNVYFVEGSLTMGGGTLALQTTSDVLGLGTYQNIPQTPGAESSRVAGTVNLTLTNDASFTGKGKLFFGFGDAQPGSNLSTVNLSLSGTSSVQGSTTNPNWVVFGGFGGTANVELRDNSFIAKAAGGAGDLLFADGQDSTTSLTSATVNAYDTSSLRSSNGVIIANRSGATASVTLHDSSYILCTTAGAGNLVVGYNGGTGTLDVTGHAHFSANSGLHVGSAGANSVGTLNYSSDATSTVGSNLYVGNVNGANATLNMSAGRIENTATSGASVWGGGNSSTVTSVEISGDSTIVSTSSLILSGSGSKTTVSLSGNAEVAFSGTSAQAWFFGTNGDSSLTMSGDSKFTLGNTYIKTGDYGNSVGKNVITLNDNAAFSLAGRITLGHYGNAGSTASLILNDNATFTVGDRILVGRDDANTDNGINTQVVLHGGTLATKYIEAGGGVSDATKNTIVVNGGTLKALDSGEFFRTTVYNANHLYVKIESGGLTFDTNGFDASVPNSLNAGDPAYGGLTKTGSGTLWLNGSNTYTGSTTVTAGALGGIGSFSGQVIVESGAALSPGSAAGTFTVAQDVTFQLDSSFVAGIDAGQDEEEALLAVTGNLDISGAALQVNSIGATGAGPYTLATFGSLTGTFTSVPDGVTVTYESNSITITLPATGSFDSWASANGVTGGADGDSDQDGIANLIEYALDLDPSGSDGSPGTFTAGTVTFVKRDEAVANGDVTYTVQTSTNLEEESWTNIPETDPNLTETNGEISYILPTGSPKIFARLVVSQPAP